MIERLKQVIDSDRATLSPMELMELKQRIALALADLITIDREEIEYRIVRDKEKRVLELRLPVISFVNDIEKG